jgi:two-component system, response regulator
MSAKGFETHPSEHSREAAALMLKPDLLVFHVNDSTDDQVLFQAACKKARVPFQWHVAESAERGISYLESLVAMSRKHAVRWPDLVILDIVMPDASGFKVLEYIRSHQKLRPIPVVIFTGCSTPERMKQAYDLGANAFHEKPGNFADTVKLVGTLYSTWSMAKRPTLES